MAGCKWKSPCTKVLPGGVTLTPEQQSDFTAGKAILVNDMVRDKQGKPYTAYIKFNQEEWLRNIIVLTQMFLKSNKLLLHRKAEHKWQSIQKAKPTKQPNILRNRYNKDKLLLPTPCPA